MLHNNSILVLGAGELGTPILHNLAKRIDASSNIKLTVLLRSKTILSQAPNINEFRSLGINILQGDLQTDTLSDLTSMFQQFDTIICCTGFAAGRGTQIKVTKAVLAAGVKRYFPWQFGVDYDVVGRASAQDLWDEQLDVRQLLLSQQRTEWVIISTGMFTSFLFEPSFGIVDLKNNIVHALGSFENTITVTTPEDIGMLTVEILFSEPLIANQVVYIAGDTITFKRLADTIDTILDRKVQRVEWSIPKLKEELREDPDNTIKKYRVAFAEGKGVAWEMNKTFNTQKGIEVVDVEQWVQKHLL